MTQGPLDDVSMTEEEGADGSRPGEAHWQRRRQRVGVELVRGGRGLPQRLEPFIAQRRHGFLWPQICGIYTWNK